MQEESNQSVPFGVAVEALKQGKKVRRKTWKNAFLFLLPANSVPKVYIQDPALRAVVDRYNDGDYFEALGSIRMFTEEGSILTGWMASQIEVLSEDWVVLTEE